MARDSEQDKKKKKKKQQAILEAEIMAFIHKTLKAAIDQSLNELLKGFR